MTWLLTAAVAGSPLYGIMDLDTRVPGQSDEAWVSTLTRTCTKKGWTCRWRPVDAPSPLTLPNDLPVEELPRSAWAGYWLAQSGLLETGREYDLVLGDTDGMRPVTVWMDADEAVTVSVGPSIGLPEEGPPIEELVEQFGLGGAVEDGARFEPRVRGVVREGLALVSEAERAALADVTLRRLGKKSPETGRRWINPAHLDTKDGAAELVLFDDFLRPTARFIGPVEAPRHTAFFTLLHEVGHAVDGAAARRGWRELTAAGEDFNQRSQAYNTRVKQARKSRASPSEVAALNEEASRLSDERAQLDARRAALEKLAAPSDDFRARFGDITIYGATEDAEAFAEAFALFHLDRPALERVSPAAAAWFASGGHLANASDTANNSSPAASSTESTTSSP